RRGLTARYQDAGQGLADSRHMRLDRRSSRGQLFPECQALPARGFRLGEPAGILVKERQTMPGTRQVLLILVLFRRGRGERFLHVERLAKRALGLVLAPQQVLDPPQTLVRPAKLAPDGSSGIVARLEQTLIELKSIPQELL